MPTARGTPPRPTSPGSATSPILPGRGARRDDRSPSHALGPRPATHVSIWADLLGVDLRQHFVDAGGIRTRVLEAGNGPALVMIHGTGGHLEAYARNVRALSAHYRVVLYDMVGHGYSDKPDRPYTIDVLSDHLVAVLDALGIERAHLSGESIGGWVAAWTAAHHPDRVGRLVLNTPGNITNKPEVMAAVRDSSLQGGPRGLARDGSCPRRVAVLRHDAGDRRTRRAAPGDLHPARLRDAR